MIVKYCVPKVVANPETSFLYQDPITKICHWFKPRQSMINNAVPDFVGDLRKKMVDEWGEPLSLQDCGTWENKFDADGRVKHPFDKGRYLNVETELKV
jgi:hypothetical protein